jgi:hypothetical protein
MEKNILHFRSYETRAGPESQKDLRIVCQKSVLSVSLYLRPRKFFYVRKNLQQNLPATSQFRALEGRCPAFLVRRVRASSQFCSEMVEKWRAGRGETGNRYVIVLSVDF